MDLFIHESARTGPLPLSIMTFITARIAGIGVEEKLFDGHLLLDQPLLATIPNDGLKIFSVRVSQSVGPRIRPECFALFIPIMGKPRQRNNSRVDDSLITNLLRLLESLGQAHGRPGID